MKKTKLIVTSKEKSERLMNGFLVKKMNGDGHYVAIMVTILLAIVVGAIVYQKVSGDSGLVSTWFDKIGTAMTTFITSITGN